MGIGAGYDPLLGDALVLRTFALVEPSSHRLVLGAEGNVHHRTVGIGKVTQRGFVGVRVLQGASFRMVLMLGLGAEVILNHTGRDLVFAFRGQPTLQGAAAWAPSPSVTLRVRGGFVVTGQQVLVNGDRAGMSFVEPQPEAVFSVILGKARQPTALRFRVDLGRSQGFWSATLGLGS